MTHVRPLVAVVAALVGLLASPARTQPGPQRRVAVTFDDLPGAPAAAVSKETLPISFRYSPIESFMASLFNFYVRRPIPDGLRV